MPLDFTLTPEQEDIKALAHEFAEKEIRPVAAHYDETEEFPWPVLKKAHEVGLTPVAVMPEAYGGGGLDMISNMLIAEELHWGCAGIAVAITGTGLAATAILAMGNEAQKQKWIREFCSAKSPVVGAMGPQHGPQRKEARRARLAHGAGHPARLLRANGKSPRR